MGVRVCFQHTDVAAVDLVPLIFHLIYILYIYIYKLIRNSPPSHRVALVFCICVQLFLIQLIPLKKYNQTTNREVCCEIIYYLLFRKIAVTLDL